MLQTKQSNFGEGMGRTHGVYPFNVPVPRTFNPAEDI